MAISLSRLLGSAIVVLIWRLVSAFQSLRIPLGTSEQSMRGSGNDANRALRNVTLNTHSITGLTLTRSAHVDVPSEQRRSRLRVSSLIHDLSSPRKVFAYKLSK